jgi:hypothetical protein
MVYRGKNVRTQRKRNRNYTERKKEVKHKGTPHKDKEDLKNQRESNHPSITRGHEWREETNSSHLDVQSRKDPDPLAPIFFFIFFQNFPDFPLQLLTTQRREHRLLHLQKFPRDSSSEPKIFLEKQKKRKNEKTKVINSDKS